MPPKRMTANPLKPARYRAGKPSRPEDSSSESEGGDEGEVEAAEEPANQRPKVASTAKIVSNLGKVDLSESRRIAQEKEERRLAAEKVERLAAEEGFVTEEEESEANDDDDDDEESGSEEESTSEEEAPRRLMIRPRFIPKSQRGVAAQNEEVKQAEAEARRKAKADELVEEQIQKDLAARAAGRKHWYDDQNEDDEDVDTTDEVDPEAEYAAWKLRELKRLKREREAIEAKEKEREEIERRKNLTEEERKEEDDEFLAKQQAEKDGRGKMTYMQKYFHKGAFYQDEAKELGLDKRDLMGTRIADDIRDRSVLPSYLQKRDMTKLGRKGASKYKDLKSEDTGRWGEFDDRRQSRNFDRDLDERFQPDNNGFSGGSGGQGANSIPLGPRKERDVPDAPSGPRNLDQSRSSDQQRDHRPERERNDNRERTGHRSRGDDYRRRDRSESRSPRRNKSRSRSRSRSPRRDRDEYRNRRKRSTSRDVDRYDSDKRRRVDSGRY
jgi:microfibrillar-associated protein 1